MPGIAGIIRKSHYDSINADLDTMVATLCHNPKSRTGTFADEAAGLWVGWATHPGAYADGMPLVVKNADAVIIFHGEHFPGDGQTVPVPGPVNDAQNATQLLTLHAIHGDQFYKELNGWFCG